MAESYSVKAVLSAVDKNFSSTFGKANKVAESLGSKVKSGLGFGVLTGIGQQAFSSITNGIRGIAGELNSSAKAWKTFEGNLGMLGKSADEIKQVKGELQDFATKTIYSASDMASTYGQLAAVGTKNCTQLVKGFGGLAAAAENPKQAMKTLSTQATQMAAKPTVAWQDFKLMMEQTPAGISAVARQMGKTSRQLVADIQDETVATEDFFDAIAQVGTNDAFTQLATQYKTVDQAMDGLQETLGVKLMPVFDELNEIGISAVSGIIEKVEQFDVSSMVSKIKSVKDELTGIVNKGAEVGAKAWNAFKNTGAIEGATKALNDVKKAIGHVISAAVDSGVIEDLAGFFGELTDQVSKNISLVADFVASLDPNLIGMFTKAIVGLVLAYQGMKIIDAATTKVKSFSNTVKSLFKKNKTPKNNPLEAIENFDLSNKSQEISAKFNGIAKIVESTGRSIKTAITGIGSVFRSAGTAISTAAKGIGEGIKTALSGVGTVITSLGTAISTVAQGIGTGLAVAFRGLGAAIAMVPPPTWLALSAAILAVGVALALAGSQGQGLNLILQGVSTVVSSMLPVVQTVVAGIVSAISQLPAIFISVGIAINTALQGVADVIMSLGTAIADVVTSISDGMATIVDSVGSAISGVLDSLAGIIDSIGNAALNAGTGFKQLASGIKTITNLNLFDMGASLAAVAAGMGAIGVSAGGVQVAANAMSKLLNSIRGISPAVAGVGASFSSMATFATSACNQMISAMTSAASRAKSAGTQIGNNVTNGIKSGMSKIPSTVSSVMSQMYSALSSAQSRAFNSGLMIGQGLANGLNASAGSVRSAAASLAAAADAAIRAKARIHSPSRVSTKDGEYWGQGWINGILNKVKDAKKAVAELLFIPNLSTPSMALDFAGGSLSSASLNENYSYNNEATYNFTIPLDIDGREVAKATAEYTSEELEELDKFNKFLKGER